VKSFSILRTNVGLTTNVKVIVDSDYNLYLDSIESNPELSSIRYKAFKFNSKNYYDELVPFFFKGTPIDIAFDIKNDDSLDVMSSDFSNQYDELYNSGARNIISNKNYKEEFEYFAPLYITSGLPKFFIVFRVDGPGIDLLTKENFVSDIVNSFKFVKKWDLTGQNILSKWLDINFINNTLFPKFPLEIDFREMEFSKWNGIDYNSGGWSSKSLFIDDILRKESEIFELEKFIFDGWKTNSVVFPNIINFSFLFDDEPSTPDFKRKWSINRYYGFYLDDLEQVRTISPFLTPKLKDDVTILEGNIINSNSGDPFIGGWSTEYPFYIEYNGEYYLVETFTETVSNQLMSLPQDDTITRGRSKVTRTIIPLNIKEQYVDIQVIKWRIMSDIDLTGKQNEINKNYGTIDSNGSLVDFDNNPIIIDGFSDYSIWLIEIDGQIHNLFSDGDSIKLNSDWSFNFRFNEYSYKVAGVEKVINLSPRFNAQPEKFKIYRGIFADIKDFDTKIVDTEYSKFEYEKSDELTITDETKMYVENYSVKTNPRDLDDFTYRGEVVNIPVSSEYTANMETFKLVGNDLTPIWNINPIWCRWSYQNSLSSNDYPYPLNNSSIFETNNRTTNTFEDKPIRSERNLDWFLTINSADGDYIHHTLHVNGYLENGQLDPNFKFDLEKYLEIGTWSGDYFKEFFGKKQYLKGGQIVRSTSKFSYFNSGDSTIPNRTLFRGLEFSIWDVESIDRKRSGDLGGINLKSSNKYEDWGLSILLSDNDIYVMDGGLTGSNNQMDWTIIDQWEMDKTYVTGSIVYFDDILYRAIDTNITTRPDINLGGVDVKSAPYNQSTKWTYHSVSGSLLWNPTQIYNDGNLIYYSDNYWRYNSVGQYSIWDPIQSLSGGYSEGDKVFYSGSWWISKINNNIQPPDSKSWSLFDDYVDSKWISVQLWNPVLTYRLGEYIVHNEIVWSSQSNVPVGEEPGISSFWLRIYSFVPDTDYIYPGTNPIIWMNNCYYLANSNQSNSTLDNGIIIYVNQKRKNILININISDNTLPLISGFNRDDLYNKLYTNLTAFNFKRAINDLSSKYGFVDYLNYVVIGVDGSVKKYNRDNLDELPVLITVGDPDELEVNTSSLNIKTLDNPKNLNPVNKLVDGNISDISKLNWWGGLPYSVNIDDRLFEPKVLPKYHGGSNIIGEKFWRFSGPYMPTFYSIELFDIHKRRFDIELSNFGIMKERKLRKVNREGSQLKLIDSSDVSSVYPMIDEFGIGFEDFFIFRSTWDLGYYSETLKPTVILDFKIDNPSLTSNELNKFGQSVSIKLKNKNNNFNL
jgi:hypothetical protein